MLGRAYQGYMQANQSVLEEEEEEEDPAHASGDIETGHAHRSSVLKGKHRVAWGGDASEMNVLRPNIKQDDAKHDNDSSDDEVPQDFMIETTTPGGRKPRSPSTPRASTYRGKEREARKQPLLSTSRKPAPPVLPTAAPVKIPPRPSELDVEDENAAVPLSEEQRPKQMRGLDAYERALWNWVNVYNLDAFLQEAYYYYEGKGIYSIALSRGLNLLSVITFPSHWCMLRDCCYHYRTVGFVIAFSTFLLGCVDYSKIRHDKATRLSDVVVSHCVSRQVGIFQLKIEGGCLMG